MAHNMDRCNSVSNGHDGDGVRRSAYDEAMARLAGRRGLRRTMSDDSRRFVAAFDGLIVAGVDPE